MQKEWSVHKYAAENARQADKCGLLTEWLMEYTKAIRDDESVEAAVWRANCEWDL